MRKHMEKNDADAKTAARFLVPSLKFLFFLRHLGPPLFRNPTRRSKQEEGDRTHYGGVEHSRSSRHLCSPGLGYPRPFLWGPDLFFTGTVKYSTVKHGGHCFSYLLIDNTLCILFVFTMIFTIMLNLNFFLKSFDHSGGGQEKTFNSRRR